MSQPMGRPRAKNHGLPPRMIARRLKRGGILYYYQSSAAKRKRISLGRDLAEAKRKWAELERTADASAVVLFADAARKYETEVIPTKAQRTQKDNRVELSWLLTFFGEMPLDAIRPRHVRAYMDERSKMAAVRANREKALLSHLWNSCREWGLTDLPNPCAGIKGNREEGRDRYITEVEFKQLWDNAAEPWMQDALDLALLTGQRVADVIKMKRADIQDGHLLVNQGKTNSKLRIRVVGELAHVVDRAAHRVRTAVSMGLGLIQDENGQTPNYWRFAKVFQATRKKAGLGKDLQFRDLRAKAGTDTGDLAAAQKLLGHESRAMTEHYVRRHVGNTVDPLKRREGSDGLD
jgi:integrase